MLEKQKDAETKIKEAARKIFLEKGFAATRTREIAEAAGMNLALLNYYFRSKKKLYDIIMLETLQTFFSGVLNVMNKEESTLKEKLTFFVEGYIDMLSANPDIAFFVMNEIRNSPKAFAGKLKLIEQLKKSVLVQQFQEAIKAGHIPSIHPMHFMMNIAGLTVFPFIASPMISFLTQSDKRQVMQVIQERKRLIPLWIEAMLTVK